MVTLMNCVPTPSGVFNISDKELMRSRMLSQSRSPSLLQGGSGSAWERHLKLNSFCIQEKDHNTFR